MEISEKGKTSPLYPSKIAKTKFGNFREGRVPGRLEAAVRFVTRDGRVDPVLCSFSWKFTESPWPNLCSVSVSRWLCIVPGSPHGLTSRRREKERCVSRLSDGCAGPLPPRQCQYPRRPNVPASSCIPIRVYSFTVWFFPDDDSFPTFLFPTFRSPLSAFSFSSFSFPSSSSSSLSEGEETAYSSFPNVEEKLVISQNFIVRISFPGFGAPNPGSEIQHAFEHGWDNCDFAKDDFLFIRFNRIGWKIIDRGGLVKIRYGDFKMVIYREWSVFFSIFF